MPAGFTVQRTIKPHLLLAVPRELVHINKPGRISMSPRPHWQHGNYGRIPIPLDVAVGLPILMSGEIFGVGL
jgi:hypothetical protein